MAVNLSGLILIRKDRIRIFWRVKFGSDFFSGGSNTDQIFSKGWNLYRFFSGVPVYIVYHVTNVASGHGTWSKFGPRVWAAFYALQGVSFNLNLCRPAYCFRDTRILPHQGHEYLNPICSACIRFAITCPSIRALCNSHF